MQGVRRLVAVLALPSLAACGPGSPPAGFRPAPVAAPNACPDLAGAWRPESTAWLEEFVPLKTAGLAGDPVAVMASGEGGSALRSFSLRSDREAFLSRARQMSITTPAAYLEWRRAVFASQPGQTNPGQASNPEVLAAAVERLGPQFEVRTILALRQCSDGWALLGYRHSGSTKDREDGTRNAPKEIELWISRSAANELLFRKVTHDVIHYSLWAPSSQTLRTSSRIEYSKWPPVTLKESGPLRAEELPDLQPVSRETCKFLPERTRQLLQQIKSVLPPGIVLMDGGPGQIHGLPRADGRCAPTPFGLDLSVDDPAALPELRSRLGQIAGLSSVEPIRPRQPVMPGSNRHVARMMAKAVAE